MNLKLILKKLNFIKKDHLELPTDVTLLFFFGSPRTGSTLLGQILNYHPQCLVASEFRYLQRLIEKNESEHKLKQELASVAFRHYKNDLSNDVDYRDTLSNYQEKWSDFSELLNHPEFAKQKIKIIGDKKAGGNVTIYQKYDQKVLNYLIETNSKIIHLIRNPYDASVSLIKSHGFENEKLASEYVLNATLQAVKLQKSYPVDSFISIYYEDLQINPQAELKRLLNFLLLTKNENWLELISTRINGNNNNSLLPDWMLIEIKNKGLLNVFNRYI